MLDVCITDEVDVISLLIELLLLHIPIHYISVDLRHKSTFLVQYLSGIIAIYVEQVDCREQPHDNTAK